MKWWKSLQTIATALLRDLGEGVRYRLRIPYALNAEIISNPARPRETYVFIHGVGNTLHSWDGVYAGLPDDVRVIGIDLLGFGLSPKPSRVEYNVKFQARSVARTLLKLRLTQRPVIIGHSLGALVAIEINRRYPYMSKHLVLCSPPIYEESSRLEGQRSRDESLRSLYRIIRRHPDAIERIAPLAVRLGLASSSLRVTKETLPAYVASLELSIENQTALRDTGRARIPIDILFGRFDPLVVGRRLQALASENDNITLHRISAGHEVTGRYVGRLLSILDTEG